ncbi:MmgE/PrpD family protein [Knoellia sp. Soil729]|uniref:MmgE/PrpD family protein n=1 Tax=Knoellia sp. Soil729 TaxID=1736394 RepID=UPI0006FB124A|nr:MmgE/PrpD family protein [Knoellia sp. Soil729]KRE44143.1 2-methylcitrate dehydratase [Knoellia sp. Soil729]
MTTARQLADWAVALDPTPEDLALADRSLQDTVAAALCARDEPLLHQIGVLGRAGRWAVASHVVDFDDLHMPSTTHISTICVPVALDTAGGARAYLAGAGVMARLGSALGWDHYSAGWHATTTSGALASAATAAIALGLDAERTAIALALAVPASGGVQRAFGTDAKSLQVGFAVDAGVRAAHLAAAGVTAELEVVDAWLRLVGATADTIDLAGPAIPDGLAVKLFPCCYALQRPIGAAASLRSAVEDTNAITRILVRTPRGTVKPLIHHRPTTGLEAKFSLEYAVAAALVDEHCGFATFSDDGVNRPALQALLRRLEVDLHDEDAQQLLSGRVELTVESATGVHTAELVDPPGSPGNPPTGAQLDHKFADCLDGTGLSAADLTWADASVVLTDHLPTPAAVLNGTPTPQGDAS